MTPARAVVLLSGGLDSGVAMAMAQAQDVQCVLALTADYGQRSAAAEASAAQRLAALAGVPWQAVALPWLAQAATTAGCALLPGGRPLPSGTLAAPGDAESAAAVWVPARNVVLLALAAAFAEAHGATQVIAGFNAEEAATFADNSTLFVQHMNAALALGTRTQVRVVSPTLNMDKLGIVTAARRLGFSRRDFWSCYAGGEQACERCESCSRSRRAWQAGSP